MATGSFREVASVLDVMFRAGRIDYEADQEDPADGRAIESKTGSVQRLLEKFPKLELRWAVLKKSILSMLEDKGSSWPVEDRPETYEARVALAEEQATRLRNIIFHVKREWYRRSTKPWMCAFPNPFLGAGATATGPPAGGGAAVPHVETSLVAATVAATSVPGPATPPATPTPSPAARIDPWQSMRSLFDDFDGFEPADRGVSSRASPITVVPGLLANDAMDMDLGQDATQSGSRLSWQLGVDTHDDNPHKEVVAFRQMVDESHTPVGDREVALEVKKHAAMARAVFLDGTEEEIPDSLMLATYSL